jgi:hypothetical protein
MARLTKMRSRRKSIERMFCKDRPPFRTMSVPQRVRHCPRSVANVAQEVARRDIAGSETTQPPIGCHGFCLALTTGQAATIAAPLVSQPGKSSLATQPSRTARDREGDCAMSAIESVRASLSPAPRSSPIRKVPVLRRSFQPTFKGCSIIRLRTKGSPQGEPAQR